MLSLYDSNSRLMSNRLESEEVVNEEYGFDKVIQESVE